MGVWMAVWLEHAKADLKVDLSEYPMAAKKAQQTVDLWAVLWVCNWAAE